MTDAAQHDVLETFDAEALGERLRALRASRGLSVRETARRLDISASALSQIERGVLRPSVHRLLAIVTVLDASVLDVFGHDAPDAGPPTVQGPPVGEHLVRRALEADVVTLRGGVTFRRLSPGGTRGVDFFESTYPPGTTGGAEHHLITHHGYEVGTVTRGTLAIEFPDGVVELGVGDSITYACETPHRLANASDDDMAVATWLIVHP